MFKKFEDKEDISSVTNAKNSRAKAIRKRVCEDYGVSPEIMEQIIPKKDTLKLVKCHEHIEMFADTQGEVLFFCQRDGPFIPTLKLLHKYPFLLPHLQVDRGAIKHVLNGSNIMCPGLTSPGARMTQVPQESVVAIMAEGKQHALAIGLTKLSSDDILDINKGVGVENLHYLNDGLWRIKPGFLVRLLRLAKILAMLPQSSVVSITPNRMTDHTVPSGAFIFSYLPFDLNAFSVRTLIRIRQQRLSQRRIAEGLLLIFIVFIILSLLAQLFSSHVHYRSKYPESSLNLVPVGGWEPCDLGRDSNPLLKEQHRLAVLVPFRDRFTELQQFLPHLDRFLTDQNVVHTFYIINQVDDFRFNRGALLNVGVLDSFKAETEGVKIENPLSHSSPPRRTHCYRLPSTDYLALHDVDLLPVDQALRYTWPTGTGPVHLLPAEIHPRYYWYKYYFGGVVLIRRVEFKDIDGMSNLFWGWGAEDDEFSLRIKRAGLKVSKPVDVTMGMNAFKIIHNEVRHVRDGQTYYDPRVRKLLRNPTGGLSTANYSVDSRRLIQISGVPALVVNVRLACNVDVDLCIESSKRLPDEPKEKS